MAVTNLDSLTLSDDLVVAGTTTLTGTVALTGGAITDSISGTDLVINSTNAMEVQIGTVGALQLDDAAISAFAAAVDTAGQDVFLETQDAGATPTTARHGAALSIKTGDGASAANAVACGNGGDLTLEMGRGGVNTGGATGEAGGAGASLLITGGEGGDTDSTGAHAGGDGSGFTIAGGAGGNATAGTGDGGGGGSLAFSAGAGGTSAGGSAGDDGELSFAGEMYRYKAGSATGITVDTVGPNADEGFSRVIVDKTVSPAAVETAVFTVPAGCVVESVLANCEVELGFAAGAGTTATWSVGTAGDPDKYGTSGYPTAADSLLQNTKSSWVATPTHLSSAEDIIITAAATGGAADGDTAFNQGSVRVVIIYRAPVALANA